MPPQGGPGQGARGLAGMDDSIPDSRGVGAAGLQLRPPLRSHAVKTPWVPIQGQNTANSVGSPGSYFVGGVILSTLI